jgi:hypothetical protein
MPSFRTSSLAELVALARVVEVSRSILCKRAGRDRIAYQALITSRFAAVLSFLAVCLNAVVAIVAVTSLNLNSKTSKQSQENTKSQIELNRQLADATSKQAERRPRRPRQQSSLQTLPKGRCG